MIVNSGGTGREKIKGIVGQQETKVKAAFPNRPLVLSFWCGGGGRGGGGMRDHFVNKKM